MKNKINSDIQIFRAETSIYNLLRDAIGSTRTSKLSSDAKQLRKTILDIKRNNPTITVEEWLLKFPEPFRSNITSYTANPGWPHRELFALGKTCWKNKKDPTMFVFNEELKHVRLYRQEIYKQLIMDPSLVDSHVHIDGNVLVKGLKTLVSIIETRSPYLLQLWKDQTEKGKQGLIYKAITVATRETDPELCKLYFPTGYRSVQKAFFNDDVPLFKKTEKLQDEYIKRRIGAQILVDTIHEAHAKWLQEGKTFTNMGFVELPSVIPQLKESRRIVYVTEGDIVDHPRFGEGIVETVEESGEHKVYFSNDETTRLVKSTELTTEEKLDALTATVNNIYEVVTNPSNPIESQRNLILRSLLAATYPIRKIARIRVQSPLYSSR